MGTFGARTNIRSASVFPERVTPWRVTRNELFIVLSTWRTDAESTRPAVKRASRAARSCMSFFSDAIGVTVASKR